MKNPTDTPAKIFTKKTATGKPANKIAINPPLKETVVFSWARMNPPTVGHARLVSEMLEYDDCDHIIYLSHSENTKRNPLPYSLKLELAQEAFGDIIQESECRDIVSALKQMRESYENIILVVGEDRVDEFNDMLMKYNESEFQFENWTVVSCGMRQTDSTDIEGISATALREAFVAEDIDTIIRMLPESLHHRADEIHEAIASKYNINEAISVIQRMKRAVQMKRHKQILKTSRRRALAKRANKQVIGKRSRRAAVDVLKKKFAAKKSLDNLSASEKSRIEDLVAKRKGAVSRLARKLVTKIRDRENTRLAAK